MFVVNKSDQVQIELTWVAERGTSAAQLLGSEDRITWVRPLEALQYRAVGSRRKEKAPYVQRGGTLGTLEVGAGVGAWEVLAPTSVVADWVWARLAGRSPEDWDLI